MLCLTKVLRPLIGFDPVPAGRVPHGELGHTSPLSSARQTSRPGHCDQQTLPEVDSASIIAIGLLMSCHDASQLAVGGLCLSMMLATHTSSQSGRRYKG